jgi:hypothetical protein
LAIITTTRLVLSPVDVSVSPLSGRS